MNDTIRLQYDPVVTIAVANRCDSLQWKNEKHHLSELYARFGECVKTPETQTEFLRWKHSTNKSDRERAAKAKDVGGFCAGELDGTGRRKRENVVNRQLLALDIDSGIRPFGLGGGVSFARYSTHSSTAEHPRFRIVAPLSRPVTAAEYERLSRLYVWDIADSLGMDPADIFTDDTTHLPEHMMFWPSASKDAKPDFYYQDGSPIDVDAVLDTNREEYHLRPMGTSQNATALPEGEKVKVGQRYKHLISRARTLVNKMYKEFTDDAILSALWQVAHDECDGDIDGEDYNAFCEVYRDAVSKFRTAADGTDYDYSAAVKKYFELKPGEELPRKADGKTDWNKVREFAESLPVDEAPAEPVQPTQEEQKAVYDSKSKSFKPVKEIPKPIPRTAAELEEKDIPPIQWIVVDTLPTGLSVVAAPPKSYKSYFALGLCTKVTRGEDFFGHKTVKAGCLYFDLESSDRRPRDRLRQILGDGPKPENLYFLTGEDDIRRIGEGFEEQLNSLLDTYTDIKLVVIDVFQLIKPAKKRGMDSYEADYAALGALNYIAKKRDICIMLIHHTKKGKDPSDIFNNMSGSTAMAGAMDTIFIISRENRTDDDAILTVSGRDVRPEELAIRWDAKRFRWSCLGTQEDVAWNKLKKEYDDSNIVKTIKHLLEENSGKWAGSASDIDIAARYTKHHINESPEKIAKNIDRFEELFMLDNIQFKKDRTGNKRFYEFILS